MQAGRLADFIAAMTRAAEDVPDGPGRMAAARPLLQRLIAVDDWLPEACAMPHPQFYRQYLLHRDPGARFSLVSFVWGPGQATPIHDHTVWGLIGMLRGAEVATPYALDAEGRPVPSGPAVRLEPGAVDAVSPELGDIHKVVNAFADRVSISIHLYGADIGTVRRHVFDPAGGVKAFISGYSEIAAASA